MLEKEKADKISSRIRERDKNSPEYYLGDYSSLVLCLFIWDKTTTVRDREPIIYFCCNSSVLCVFAIRGKKSFILCLLGQLD